MQNRYDKPHILKRLYDLKKPTAWQVRYAPEDYDMRTKITTPERWYYLRRGGTKRDWRDDGKAETRELGDPPEGYLLCPHCEEFFVQRREKEPEGWKYDRWTMDAYVSH